MLTVNLDKFRQDRAIKFQILKEVIFSGLMNQNDEYDFYQRSDS